MKNIVIIFFAILTSPANAQSIFDIGIFESMASIEERYPDFKFEEEYSCKMSVDEKCFIVSGSSLEGIVFFNFADHDRLIKRKLADAIEYQKNAPIGEQLHLQKQILDYQLQIDRPKKYKLLTKSFTWIPENKIPLEKLHKKFGSPKKEFITDNLNTIQVFENGIRAVVDRDGLTTSYINFSPTKIQPF